ncbi:hypothetical protein NDU88_006349 [Pleurodeles waltl]|uniref:Uncharacterized protein n=1 Tax=Pleurodeles waltl TaxID=8319 RepID=A0AAV7X0F0_PLEWA|nr:hypothetical protein NDU88_006349 [Pleurodeles waltl]
MDDVAGTSGVIQLDRLTDVTVIAEVLDPETMIRKSWLTVVPGIETEKRSPYPRLPKAHWGRLTYAPGVPWGMSNRKSINRNSDEKKTEIGEMTRRAEEREERRAARRAEEREGRRAARRAEE